MKTSHQTLNQSCPVSATLHLIGGKYKALLLWHLTGRILRFSQLRLLVPEATPKMLTQQLRELEAAGLILRTVYPVVPPKVEYALTDEGQSLFPILEAMYDWGSDLMRRAGRAPACSMGKGQQSPGQSSCRSCCAASNTAEAPEETCTPADSTS